MNEIFRQNLFYRDEGKELLVYTKKSDLKILNPSATQIFKLLDSCNTVEKLTEKMQQMHSHVDKERIKADVLECLFMFYNLGYIRWKGREQYMKTYDNLTSMVVAEEDYPALARKFTDEINRHNNKISLLKSVEKEEYSIPVLRTLSIYLKEVYFVNKIGNCIEDCISISGLANKTKVVTIMNIIGNDKQSLMNLYDYIEKQLKDKEIVKIEAVLVEDNRPESVIELLEEVGFNLECCLRKEYQNKDMYVYSKFLISEG